MSVDTLSEVEVSHDIRYNPNHRELRFYDDGKLACTVDMASGKAEFHGNYQPDAIAKIFWACIAAKAPEALAAHALALSNAVIGDVPEDRQLWRINWLKSLLDAVGQGELVISDRCDDPDAMQECIGECRNMVRDVNAALGGCHAPTSLERAVDEGVHPDPWSGFSELDRD